METQSFYPRLRVYYRNLVPLFEKPKVAAYTMLVLSFFTIAIFGIFAIRPTLATIAKRQKEITDQRAINTRMDEKINQLRVAEAEYRSITPSLNVIFQAMPASPQASELLGKFNRILIENNIDVTIFQISSVVLSKPTSSSARATVIGFSLTGRASYDNILRFVDLLSHTDRILTLDSVDITLTSSPGTAGSLVDSNLLTVAIRGKSYVLWDVPEGEKGL